MDRLDAVREAGRSYDTTERTTSLVEFALRDYLERRGPFELVLLVSGREKRRVPAELVIADGFVRFLPVTLDRHPGNVDTLRLVTRDGTVVHEVSWRSVTAFSFVEDSVYRADVGIVADLDPCGTGLEFLRAAYDDDMGIVLATKELFGTPLTAVRDSAGRISGYASTLPELQRLRREAAG